MLKVNGLEVHFVPMSMTVYPQIKISAVGCKDEPYVSIMFYGDPTITVYYQDFDGSTVSGFIAAVELAGEFARRGQDWRPADA